jgi:hypothetical protein
MRFHSGLVRRFCGGWQNSRLFIGQPPIREITNHTAPSIPFHAVFQEGHESSSLPYTKEKGQVSAEVGLIQLIFFAGRRGKMKKNLTKVEIDDQKGT